MPRPASDSAAMAVVQVTAENTSEEEIYLANYLLYLREYSAPVLIKPQNGFVYIRDLKPDTIYNGEQIRTVINERRISPNAPVKLNAALWTTKNDISIFPYRIDIVQEDHPTIPGQVVQSYSLHLLSVTEKMEIAETLSSYRNFEYWDDVTIR